jgi:D-tyrosyl-tRNA(Tyr) deacylase
LYGDCRRGRRPSFTDAAPPEVAETLYGKFVETLRQTGLKVATGVFGARMQLEIHNDGPVTLIVDSEKKEGIVKNQD